MKAEDLMIGDLVFWDLVTHKVDFDGDVMTNKGYETSRRIIKVSSVNEAGVTFKSLKDGSQIYIREEDLVSIPLTKEILEKNGFEKLQGEKFTWFICNVAAFDIRIVSEKNNLYDIKIAEYPRPITYVHELQHLLKLCKIEKEIVL